jgi:hypothetical protein
MRVRALDSDHDWTFGKGQNNYFRNNLAVVQNIDTRLQSFLGDCFFDTGAGIDWFTLLGAKDQLSLTLSISSTILNTADVTGLEELSVELSETTRRLTCQYKVQTIYSQASGVFQFDPGGSV